MRFQGYDQPGQTRDYDLIAKYALRGIRPTEVTSEEYFEKLNVLPPIYVTGGFLVCEAVTDVNVGGKILPVYQMYAEHNGRYFGKYVVGFKPETYITAQSALHAYPLEEAANVG